MCVLVKLWSKALEARNRDGTKEVSKYSPAAPPPNNVKRLNNKVSHKDASEASVDLHPRSSIVHWQFDGVAMTMHPCSGLLSLGRGYTATLSDVLVGDADKPTLHLRINGATVHSR